MIWVWLKGLEKLLEIQKWRKIANLPDVESTESDYKCSNWKRARRFKAIRIVTYIDDENDLLFNLPKVQYKYFCYVTDMRQSPMGAHRYYG